MQFPLFDGVEVTDALISGKHRLTQDQICDRLFTACHEAAHLVAAAACPKSYPLHLTLKTRSEKRGTYGACSTLEIWPDQESFVSLVGYVWEELHGTDPKRARTDYERGFKPTRAYMLDDARAFVKEHRIVIIRTATTILDLIPKHGRLDGKKLHALFAHLREEWVTPYISGYVNGKLGKYDDW